MENIDYLIQELMQEHSKPGNSEIPKTALEKRKLLRSLMNIRKPGVISEAFLQIQDELLTQEVSERGIVEVTGLPPIHDVYPCANIRHSDKIVLWRGNIIRLDADAIVNAANCKLLGCFAPSHECIDNTIHSAAGIQLRNECSDIMKKQKHDEVTGAAKVTGAYNLPCKYIIHTVGPIINHVVTRMHKEQLRSCYMSCMNLAEKMKLKTIAFCCISTGEFHFPNELAANIAVNTIDDFLDGSDYLEKVVINVCKGEDYSLYQKLFR